MDKKRYYAFLLLGLVILAALVLPNRIEQKKVDAFAKALNSHSTPEGARVVQRSAAKDKDGGCTAALILATDLSQQELEAYYGDTEYPPFRAGQTVTVKAKPLDESSLTALEKAGLSKDGESYWFVYIYSAPQ